ncbi:MAG: HAD-IIB family hydrolase [Legionella sp.]|nr:HAD-IIB family hydrolase [Legionella sp.]
MVTEKISNDIVSCPRRFKIITKHERHIIFTDLDETLYDHNDPHHYWFHELEEYLKLIRIRNHALFGIVTGCNLEETKSKIKDLDMHLLPDFISVGFGTDIYYRYNHNAFIQDLKWKKSLMSLYNKSIIERILNELKKHDIHLVKEDRSDNVLKDSYYYFVSDPEHDKFNLRIINLIAYYFKIKAIISKCNTNIGDPCNAYDIDFVPYNSGKDNVAKYLTKNHNIHKNNVFAFGDSENDLTMLKTFPHGYAVSNATDNLKKYINKICKYNHCRGILDTLRRHFGD